MTANGSLTVQRRDAVRPAATHQAPVHLTRRGKLVLWVVALGVTLVAMVAIAAPAVSTDTAHHPRTELVVVQPGQTVWDVAREAAPESDPRAVVAEIAELNHLADAGAVRVGQPLRVPVG